MTVSWNWLDEDSGLDPANCVTDTTTQGRGTITTTATCADRAGNESAASYTVKVDSDAPSVATASPAPRSYWQDTVVTADYTCSDQLSGMEVCTGPVADGAPIDTSSLGAHRFVVTGRDRAGNSHAATVSYTVVPFPTCRGQRATIIGTSGSDVIAGTRGDDVIVTGEGRDWVRAAGGDDLICTGAARDVVSAGLGDDTVDSDVARDTVYGGDGNDTLTGGPNADVVSGGTGDDTVTGSAGDDAVLGHDGDDHVAGGSGADICRGGRGLDQATTCERTVGIP